MKSSPSPQRPPFAGIPIEVNPAASQHNKAGISLMAMFVRSATALFIGVLLFPNTPTYADSLSEIKLITPPDSLSSDGAAARQDSSAISGGAARQESRSIIAGNENDELTNIVPTTKKLRVYGWGEYQVGGRCLCCDNMLDGDCIIVHNTNITERRPIKQIVDGKIEGDTSDATTFFGDLVERERPEHVGVLMAEITLNKLYDVYEVIVYTITGGEKKSHLSNCELGYYDQFDRLQWAGKVENKKGDDHITFELKRPVFTKSLLLKVKGGKNRITEVAVFCKKSKE